MQYYSTYNRSAVLDGYKHFRKNKQGRQEGNKVVLAIQEIFEFHWTLFLICASWMGQQERCSAASATCEKGETG